MEVVIGRSAESNEREKRSENMKAKLIINLIGMLVGLLTPELLRDLAESVIEFAEAKVIGSKSKIDDALVLPLCQLLRTAFDLSDKD